MSFKFKHLEKIVGFFLTLAFLIVVAVIVMIGREQRWFEKQYTYTTKFNSGENISIGMQVRIRGIQTGEVKSVFLTENNLIEVKFRVFQEYAERIRKDSVIKKRSPLIGTKYLEVIPGEANMPALASGSYVWSEDTVEGRRILSTRLKEERPEQVQRILDNVEILTYKLGDDNEALMLALLKIQQFFDTLSAEDGDLNNMLANLESITRSIDEAEGSLGRLIYDDYEVYEKLNAIMGNLNVMTDNFEELSQVLADSSPEVKAAMENVNRTMDEAIGLIDTLQDSVWLRGASKRTEKSMKPTPIQGDLREGGYAPDLEYTR
jgi:phospholipid/cholesterol/gamma-HCH transport system substrate-binding protein